MKKYESCHRYAVLFFIFCLMFSVLATLSKPSFATGEFRTKQVDLQKFNGIIVEIKAQDWTTIINELARSLNVNVVSFAPNEIKISSQNSLKGDAPTVLNQIATISEGIWLQWHNTLVLVPDLVPELLRNSTAKNQFSGNQFLSRFPAEDINVIFLQSFDIEQQAYLREGKSLSFGMLNKNQIGLLEQIGKQVDPILGAALPNYINNGTMSLSLNQSHPLVYYRGQLLNAIPEQHQNNLLYI